MAREPFIVQNRDRSRAFAFHVPPNIDYSALVRLGPFYQYVTPLFGRRVPRFREWPAIYQQQEARRWNANNVEDPTIKFTVIDDPNSRTIVSKFEGRHRVRYAHEVLNLENIVISFYNPSNRVNVMHINGQDVDEDGPIVTRTKMNLINQDGFTKGELERSTFFVRYL